MFTPVDYRIRTYQLALRVNGWLFPQVWLATYSFENVLERAPGLDNIYLEYTLMVEDPTFGRFELPSNMVVEWKTEGRWYQTKPQLVIDSLLNGGAYDDRKAQEG
jgi:hypothetical protein